VSVFLGSIRGGKGREDLGVGTGEGVVHDGFDDRRELESAHRVGSSDLLRRQTFCSLLPR